MANKKHGGGVNTAPDGEITENNGKKEFDGYIDKQTAGMVLLYIDINEMLSDINSTLEISEVGRKAVLS